MKTVLITGVGKGIGKALAEKFLKNNDFVIGTFLSSVPSIFENHFEAVVLDLSNPESIENAVEEIRDLNRRIDVLINNSGVLLDVNETSVVIEKLRETLEVNLIGTIDFTEKIIPILSDEAHILNISSSAGSLNRPISEGHIPYHYPSYKISKTALNMYTRTLAGRLKDRGIIVSSVHPGWVKTDMGGPSAEMEPAESAEHIFKLANSKIESGQFWFKGIKYPW